jgi:biotin operon repressor
MPRPSSISRMPEPIRAEIGRLRTQGCTIDQILAHLRTLYGGGPSRSALGRHIQGLDKIGEQMRRSRTVAESLVRELGTVPESQTARLNIELMHSIILDVFMKAADGETIDEAGKAALTGDPEGLMLLAKALDHLGRANKSTIEAIKMAKAEGIEIGKRLAAKAAEGEAVRQGLSVETIKAIKVAIFGVAA